MTMQSEASSLIRLNIGGKKFCTTLDTLTQREPNSMLAAMFSGRHTVCPDPETGCVFIDRDNEHFRHILNWLRDGVVPALESSNCLELLREAEFYQLTGLSDGIHALLNGDQMLGVELTRFDIIRCIQTSGRIRFRGLNLSGLDLSNLDLSCTTFSHACLRNVCFRNCAIGGSNFNYADVEGAIFDNAFIGGSAFRETNLRRASFVGANLNSGELIGACLINCNFYKADLNHVYLRGVDLMVANFEGANLEDARIEDEETAGLEDEARDSKEYEAFRHLMRQGAKLDGAMGKRYVFKKGSIRSCIPEEWELSSP